MKTRSHSLGRAARRGQALVEFALVIPILIVLLMGVVDVGRVIFSYIALEDAVQEGVMYRSYYPSNSNEADVRKRVQKSSDHAEVANALVEVPPCTATTVKVTGTYGLPMLTPFARVIFGETYTLAATLEATNLKGNCS